MNTAPRLAITPTWARWVSHCTCGSRVHSSVKPMETECLTCGLLMISQQIEGSPTVARKPSRRLNVLLPKKPAPAPFILPPANKRRNTYKA